MQTAIEQLPKQTDDWEQEHMRIVQKYGEIIEKQIPSDILIEGLTIDFSLPSEGIIAFSFDREAGDIKERVIICAAPSYYKNLFKNRRRTFYKALARNAIPLGKGQGGRNLYIIPFSNIAKFMETVEELREEFKRLENEINAYLRGETGEDEADYLQKVKKHLEDQNVSDKALNLSVKLNFKVSLFPLRIDSRTFMSFASDSINEKMRNSLQLLEEEFEATRENIISNMIADLTERFSTILHRLADALENKTYVRYDSITKAIDETMNLANSLSLNLPTFKQLADATRETAEVLSSKNHKRAAIMSAALKIARVFDIEEEDPNEILKKASYDLTSMSARAAELIRRL